MAATTPKDDGKQKPEGDGAEPETFHLNHQDSIFGNAFGSRSYYVIHPEWISEASSDPQPEPCHRPPWPWEQPPYRVIMRVPRNPSPEDEKEVPPPLEPSEIIEQTKQNPAQKQQICEPPPPMSHELGQMYLGTHPPYRPRYY